MRTFPPARLAHRNAMLALILTLGAVLRVSDDGFSAAETRPGNGRPAQFALLVGVQNYSNLSPNEQLKGCRNDVDAMKNLLARRFHFQTENIATLVDSQATSMAIRQHLKTMIDKARSSPPDGPRPHVVLYFSGHGSLMPDQPEGDPDCDKLDGVDQTLVPYDAERQGGPQDIRDDEVHRFVEAVCHDGTVTALVMLDCCHSGRGVRGATRFRGLERNVTIPRPVSGEEREVTPKSWPPGAVILTACRKAEKEPEYDEGDSSHGLMTRFLVEVLNAENAISRITYETLRMALIRRYEDARLGLAAPTPTLEGMPQALRGSFLGADSQMDRKPFWPVEASEADPGTARLKAGLLHGVTKGSLYELYESPEQIVWGPNRTRPETEKSLAWLKIEIVENSVATGTVFEWEGAEQQEQIDSVLPRGFKRGFAVERRRPPGDVCTKVRVVRAIDANTDGPPLGPSDRDVSSVIRQLFEGDKQDDGPTESVWVEGNSPCDVLLRIDGQHAALFPATGWANRPESPADTYHSISLSLAGGWAPVDLTVPEKAHQDLAEALRRITHARKVLRDAAAACSSDGGSTRFDTEVVRVTTVNKGDDFQIEAFHEWPSDEPLVLKNGQDFVVRIRNIGADGKPVYVTILLVDPDMEIQCMLPDRYVQGEVDSQQRIEAGERRVTGVYRCMPPFGPHRVVVYATHRPSNFGFLAQPSLRVKRGSEEDGAEARVVSFEVRP